MNTAKRCTDKAVTNILRRWARAEEHARALAEYVLRNHTDTFHNVPNVPPMGKATVAHLSQRFLGTRVLITPHDDVKEYQNLSGTVSGWTGHSALPMIRVNFDRIVVRGTSGLDEDHGH